MNWQEVCEHPSLKDLPFKIELDETGKIIMCPVKFDHSLFQGEIEFLLRLLLKGGKPVPECAIKTRKGTKAADVAWLSFERIAKSRGQVELEIAPEICIEVLSESNTQKEMAEKRALYFEVGAKEVWLCSENGEVRFFNAEHELIHSELVPDFPLKINV
jgi:Uma2 family endonuclease